MKKHIRVVGTERAELGRAWRQRYDTGESIRQITENSGRSYGFVRQVIAETGATLRPRGGQRRRP